MTTYTLTYFDIVQKHAPGLVEHQERVAKDTRVLAYYASRR